MKKECCPKFNPKKWDKKTFHWKNKPFIMESIPTLFHIPFPPMIGNKIKRMMDIAEKARKVSSNKEDMLILFHDPSLFKSEIYLSVNGKISNANNVNISGEFIAKVFAGDFSSVPKFMKQTEEYLFKKGKTAKDYYIHYAYCPECAKKYCGNYMIIFAKIK